MTECTMLFLTDNNAAWALDTTARLKQQKSSITVQQIKFSQLD
jgi:hypothetical protein